MENDLWIKDQLEAGIKVTIDEIDRSAFSELKPYSEEVDNIVKVKPGRFTARINDPMADARQQEISRVAGEVFYEDNAWKIATLAASGIQGAVSSLTSLLADDATFMNGLYERAFAHETIDSYNAPLPLDESASDPRTLLPPANTSIFIPGVDAMFLIKDKQSIGSAFRFDEEIGQYVKYSDTFTNRSKKFIHASKALEHTFIKFWRGVTRTAVVDVPDELSIEIPSFNINDFNYKDSDGTVVQRLDAEVRIDLLFIYSKPVDTSHVKVRSTQGRSFSRTITRAELGLVKGAGVLLDKTETAYGFAENGAAEDLGTKILANIADSLSTSGGFAREQVYGSFPAPDDLMTMTPLLMTELEEGHPSLIGQSILPIAYIVVTKPDGAASTPLITNSNIIDIRPFFRTTELSYNERAGIAAATWPVHGRRCHPDLPAPAN